MFKWIFFFFQSNELVNIFYKKYYKMKQKTLVFSKEIKILHLINIV
jgi:hypothetical protein